MIRSLSRCALLLPAIAVAGAHGQDPQADGEGLVELRAVTPLELETPDAPVRLQRQGELVMQVLWTLEQGREVQLPLTTPVHDLDVALSPDRNTLVVLAGGVQAGESLDLYLVGRGGGIHVLETRGGRRLPARFNGGLGSWPLMEGEHLVLFAYQRQGRLEFRALDTHGHVHASRTLAEGAEPARAGFRASWHRATGKVRVEFGEGEVLEFPHPLAARLEVSEGLLDFGTRPQGKPAARALELRNSGRMDLRLRLSTGTGEFAVQGPPARVVPPGERAEVRVLYLAATSGPAADRLDIISNAANGRVSVSLRGAALSAADPAAVADPGQAAEPVPVPEPVPSPPSQLPALERPAVPSPLVLEIAAVDGAAGGGRRVAVEGLLAAAPEGTEPPAAVAVRAGDGPFAQRPVGPGSAFRIELSAAPGEELWLAVIGRSGRTSPARSIGRVVPYLEPGEGGLSIHGPAGARFVLAAVLLDPGRQRPQRVLASWNGRLDAAGTCRLLSSDLGLGPDPLDLIVLLPDHGPDGLLSNVLSWP